MKKMAGYALVTLIATFGLVATAMAQAADLPPLPSAIQKQGVIRVGTKCDYPPDGFLDNSGKPTGIEVSMARQIAKYAFGDTSKAQIHCVTSSNRIPTLLGGKVDLLIATLGITKKRAEVVDFTDPYAWSASSVLVMNDSKIHHLKDLKGHTVVFVKGAWQIPWFEKHMPDVRQLRLNSVSDAMQALMQGRADGYAHDLPVQVTLDEKNDRVRMLPERYKIGLRGAAVRPGEKQWLAYVNSAIKKMEKDGDLKKWILEYTDPAGVKIKLKLWDMSQMPKQ